MTPGTGTLSTCPVGLAAAGGGGAAGNGAGNVASLTGGATTAPGRTPRAELSTLPVGAAGNALAISADVSGGGGPAQLWWGDSFAHDDRYGRTSEWLDIFRGVWENESFTYNGRFYQVENAQLPAQLRGADFPDLWFSGSSEAALQVAARHADYYLSWLEPFDQLADKFARVKERTAALGAEQKVSVRVDILARKTEEEAWRDIAIAFDNVSDETRARWRNTSGDSVGAARLAALRPTEATRWEDLKIAPGLWGGFNLLRGGPSIGIVGSYEQAAEKLDQLIQLGTDGFILAGTPHLEEAFRVGEEVLPLLGQTASALLEAAE